MSAASSSDRAAAAGQGVLSGGLLGVEKESHVPQQEARVVVGIDGSAQSKEALRWAVRMAELNDAAIDAVTVWEMPTSYGWAIAAEDWNPEQDASKVLSDTIDEVLDGHGPSGLRQLVRRGNAAKVLLDESKDAQMLVVGSRGHGGFSGLLLGSVSAPCAEHARCPVLVVHGSQASTTL